MLAPAKDRQRRWFYIGWLIFPVQADIENCPTLKLEEMKSKGKPAERRSPSRALTGAQAELKRCTG